MPSEVALFSPELISPAVQNALPQGYIARPLERSDFANGHLDVLLDLAHVGDISEEQWIERFDWMKQNGCYYVVVFVNSASGRIVATATLVVEKKL
jgi:glucosamine-phosphate N-acetyltransferase